MRELLSLVLLLALAAPAAAVEYAIEVSTAAVSELSFEGETIHAFQVTLPEGLDTARLLKASLSVLAGPPAGSEEDFVEVQVAQWQDGAPVIPADKARLISLGVERARATAIQLDLRPIVESWSGGTLDLVLGKLSEDCWGEPQVAALDAGDGIFCVLHLVTE